MEVKNNNKTLCVHTVVGVSQSCPFIQGVDMSCSNGPAWRAGPGCVCVGAAALTV